jgi:beta-glucanase (GH16 family)
MRSLIASRPSYGTVPTGTNWWGKRWLDQGEQEVYVDPTYQGTAPQPLDLSPFSVTNGILQIQAPVPPPTVVPYLEGQKYLSGLLTTYNSFSQLYGYFEIRAQIPAGKGYWPAFWLLPKVIMATPPEIDILEARGDRLTKLYLTVHYIQHAMATMSSFAISVPDMSSNFHRYGLLWTRDFIAWYFDGVLVADTTTPEDMHSPMCMLLNLAVGGNGTFPGTPDKSTKFLGNFLVDYIRVYPVQ